MLVLTRFDNEAIWIGETRVSVERHGKKLKVYIEAPADVPVVREELLNASDLQALQSRACARQGNRAGRRPGP